MSVCWNDRLRHTRGSPLARAVRRRDPGCAGRRRAAVRHGAGRGSGDGRHDVRVVERRADGRLFGTLTTEWEAAKARVETEAVPLVDAMGAGGSSRLRPRSSSRRRASGASGSSCSPARWAGCTTPRACGPTPRAGRRQEGGGGRRFHFKGKVRCVKARYARMRKRTLRSAGGTRATCRACCARAYEVARRTGCSPRRRRACLRTCGTTACPSATTSTSSVPPGHPRVQG